MKQIENMAEVAAIKISEDRPFYSATHEEIAAGLTTDIYFVKTQEILKAKGLADTPVCAEIFGRKDGVFCGLQEVLNLLKDKDISIWALPEGSRIKPKDVVMRIEGKYSEFGLFEAPILGMLASSTGWATAASVIKEACGDTPVTCFGARHVHPAVAPVMERAALVGGVDGASCILGAKLYGAEPSGTAPHALILIMGDTVEAALAYDEVMPPSAARLMLVDTFKDEAEESLRLAKALQDKLDGIRLDTPSERGGVRPELVREIRARLDQAGFNKVKIFASGGLYPEKIQLLKDAGVDAFGAGSFISAAPPIDMTMDLKEVNFNPIAKRGRIPGKTPSPNLVKMK